MTICNDLRQAVLQAAIQGKLTEQLPTDSSVDDLLASIVAKKEELIKQKKIKKEKPLSPISEDEIPFDVPENWRWVKLGNLSSFISDGTHKTPAYVDKGIPFLSVQNISKGYFDFTKIKYVSEETHKELTKRCCPEKEDILICRIGTLGKAIKNTLDYEFSIFVSLGLIRLIESNLVDYVITVLNSPWGYKWIDSVKVGGGTHTNKINLNSFPEFLIPLPPTEEQQRIVDKVEELMAKIDEMEKTEQALESIKSAFPDDMKAAILQAAMQGKLTEQLPTDSSVDDLLSSIAAEKEELIKRKKIKKGKTPEHIIEEDYLFDIPENWRWERFGNLVSYNMGKTPPRAEIEHWGNDFPWVSISDMPENGVVSKTKEKVSAYAIENTFKNSYSPAGTLLMSFKLTVGRVSYLGIDAVHNEAIISIFPIGEGAETTKQYLFKILPFITQYGDSKNAIKGKTLNDTSISNLMIPIPPIEEQQRIVEKLDRLLPLCDNLSAL